MRTLTGSVILVAGAILGSSCGSPTDAGPAIDHLEIDLRPVRSSYPLTDTARAAVTAVSREGTWLPAGPTTWKSLTPAIATVDSGGLIRGVARGEATIQVEMHGVTAQVIVPIRGVLHRGNILDHSETWLVADTPHVVERALVVGDLFGVSSEDTVVLTIEPGATVRFRPGAGLNVGDIEPGAIVIPPGGDPVVMEDDDPSAPSPSWQGLRFSESRSQLRNLTLRHCGQDYPFDNPGACIIAGGGSEILIDGVTIDQGRNGVSLGGALTPGSRDLSVVNTKGYVATIAPYLVGPFPRGGAFTGNEGTEILVGGGVVRDSVNWSGLGLPLRLRGGVSFEGPANPILTLPAGFHLRSDAAGKLSFSTGGLIAGDGAGPPVVLESTGDGWRGIEIGPGGGSALRNVVLQDCGGSEGYPWNACLRFGPEGGGDSGLVVQDVVVRGSRTIGVTMAPGARFSSTSRNLTITQSATYPLGVHPGNIPSIPDGDYRFNGIDAIDVIGSGIGSDSATWRNLGVPYRFRDGLGVGAILVLEPGVTIEVGLGMLVGAGFGNLVAVGTPADPIVFRSVTPGVPGSWLGIELGGATLGPGTRLEHVVIADAGAGSPGYAGAIRLTSDPGGLLRNSTILRSSSCGLVMFNGQPWTDDYTDPAFGNTFVQVAGPLRCVPPS
jgi:hypothetical protein